MLRDQVFRDLPLRIACPIQRLLPFPLRLRDLKLSKLRLGVRELLVQLPDLRLLWRSWRLYKRRRIAVLECHPPLRYVIEIGEELIKLLLQDRIVLVVVAARASQRKPK